MIKIIKNKQILISRAATSCGTQGEAGKDGAQGAQGVQGAQGEKGDKGDKGDPVYTVVLLSKGVATDKISGISGEKYTLTFTAPADGQIVTSLSINYEDVPLTEEILKGSYTGTFSAEMKNGAVVVSASFGTVESYGQGLVQDYYNSLASADSQMDILVSGVATERSGAEADVENPEYVSEFVKGSYYDKSVAKVAKEYYSTKVGKAIKDTNTTLENVKAVQDVFTEAKTKIDEKYAAVVKEAKVNAKSNIAKLYASAPKAMAAADVTAMKGEAETKLEAATTLQGIGEVIDKTVSFNSPILVGNYNEIERLRSNAFSSIKDTIDGIYAADPSFDEGSTTESKAAYAAFKAQLAGYGITELPTDIYTSYKTKISEAKSFEYYVDEDDVTSYSVSKLEDEAVNAISDAYDGILDAVKKAVLESYYKEIAASTALTDDSAKQNCRGMVETTVSKWFLDHKSDKSVAKFLSYKDTDQGGLYAIETMLDLNYDAFQDERLATVKKSVIANLKSTVSTILEGDDLYASIVNIKIKGEKGVKTDATGDDVYADHAAAAAALKIDVALFDSVRGAAGKTDIGYVLSEAIKTDGAVDTAATKVITLKAYEQTEIGVLQALANTQLDAFLGAVTTKIEGLLAGISVTNVAQGVIAWNEFAADDTGTATVGAELKKSFTSLFKTSDGKIIEGTTMSAINDSIASNNVSSWEGLAETLIYLYRDMVKVYLTGGTSVDTGVKPYDSGDVGMYPVYAAALKGIVAGTITTYDDVVSALSGVSYSTSVEEFLKNAKDKLNQYVNNKIATGTTPTNNSYTRAAYEAWVAAIGETGFECDTTTSISAWLSAAETDIDTVYDAPSAADQASTLKTQLKAAASLAKAKELACGLVDAYIADDTNYDSTPTNNKFGIDENTAAAESLKDTINGKTTISDVYGLVLTDAATDDAARLVNLAKSTAKVNFATSITALRETPYALYKNRTSVLGAADTTHNTAATANFADYIAKLKATVIAADSTDVAGTNGMIDALKGSFIQDIKDAATIAEVQTVYNFGTGAGSALTTAFGAYDAAASAINTAVLASYKTSVKAEMVDYVNDLVLKNPSKAKELRDGFATIITSYATATTGLNDQTKKSDIDKLVSGYKTTLEALLG